MLFFVHQNIKTVFFYFVCLPFLEEEDQNILIRFDDLRQFFFLLFFVAKRETKFSAVVHKSIRVESRSNLYSISSISLTKVGSDSFHLRAFPTPFQTATECHSYLDLYRSLFGPFSSAFRVSNDKKYNSTQTSVNCRL